MNKAEYEEYLRSEHWRSLRLQAFKKYKRRCGLCGFNKTLQVHHHTYRFPWELCTVEDVCIRCDDCHRKEHGLEPSAEHSLTTFQRKVIYFFRYKTGIWVEESALTPEHVSEVDALVAMGKYERSDSKFVALWKP